MTISNVIRLDDYRTRREQRRREVFALYGADGERSRLVLQLWRAVSLLGADRAASVWIDEYGPGLVHVYCLLDLAADPPRRDFRVELLRAAWDQGVPGMCDVPDAARVRAIPLAAGVQSACAIALGSDGARAWFMVVDSLSARAALDDALRADLMFSAGECAGLVLHRDLGEPGRERGESRTESIEHQRRTTFGGWPVLRDIEGREEDEDANQRIARRFLVARVVRTLVDEDFAVDRESLGYQVKGVRDEIRPVATDDPERRMWDAVLEAAGRLDLQALAGELLRLGDHVETTGHLHGAREIYRVGYDVAAAAPDVAAAIDAARFHARACRKLADWPEAERWYARAFEMATTVEDHARCALALDGLASTHRFRGNMPKTRETLDRALEYASRADDRRALASVHHNLMIVEKHFERLTEACVHGWKAVQLYPDDADRLLTLLDLAHVLVQLHACTAARDAYAVAARRFGDHNYRLLAILGLAYTSALLGEKQAFQQSAEALEGERWREAPPPIRTQILLFLGLAHAAMRRLSRAKELVTEALAVAEEHKLNKLLFQAQAALEELTAPAKQNKAASPGPSQDFVDPRLTEVSEGLQRLGAELAGAPGP